MFLQNLKTNFHHVLVLTVLMLLLNTHAHLVVRLIHLNFFECAIFVCLFLMLLVGLPKNVLAPLFYLTLLILVLIFSGQR